MNKESCLIIAGEKSGEEHALSFLPQIIKKCPQVEFFGVGGDDFHKLGVDVLYHLRDFSSWGINDVLKKIPFYIKAFYTLLREVRKRNCKMAILVDFQDFNLKLAKKLKRRGVKVFYYVAPQAWAWKEYRTKALNNSVHTLFTILPFEKEWFSTRGVHKVKSVTHPLYAKYAPFFLAQKSSTESTEKRKKIVLLPGSRNREVRELLPLFVKALQKWKQQDPDIFIVLVQATSVAEEIYTQYQSSFDQIYQDVDLAQALAGAHFALAASGTVTLATALFQVPTVVCYRGSLLEEFIYQQFITYRGPISLANIVLQKNIFPELLQEQVTVENILKYFKKWSEDPQEYYRIKNVLKQIPILLQGEEFDFPNYFAQVLSEPSHV
ncbi:MAG: lipid-A-disaccharide synthase [Bacteriovoracaceae bacterium]|nr:lipid-A-disaccharide synthase [Bacteriovoracaceae bacterium]